MFDWTKITKHIQLISEQRLCETGYFSDVVGYRKVYGDCYGNDLPPAIISTLVDCAQMCDENEECGAFSFVNPPIFKSLSKSWDEQMCLLKSQCKEGNLDTPNPGIYTYFRGLSKSIRLFSF